MDIAALRSQFPVFEQVAYLNAGTCGPLPGQALRAGADVALLAAEQGRSTAYWDAHHELTDRLRAAYAGVVGATAPHDVALTTATSDGMVRVLEGLRLGPGDVVLTAPDEHPGLLGPLAAYARTSGIEVRTAPFERLHEAVTPDTKLVACSHVSWVTGLRAPRELSDLDVPVLLDGAQGAGAIPVDVGELGCAFYAAAGQKWLCGPMGTGLLWVDPAWRERLTVTATVYGNLENPGDGLAAAPHPDARALDTPALSPELMAAALASFDLLASAGWDAVHARAVGLAAQLAEVLHERGLAVTARDDTTLVSFAVDDPEATVERAAAAGVTVRSLPGTPYVRASVGAWNDDTDLARLLAVL